MHLFARPACRLLQLVSLAPRLAGAVQQWAVEVLRICVLLACCLLQLVAFRVTQDGQRWLQQNKRQTQQQRQQQQQEDEKEQEETGQQRQPKRQKQQQASDTMHVSGSTQHAAQVSSRGCNRCAL
jgi:hypothetical protein